MVVTTKSFFYVSPTTTKMVDVLLATALDLVNIKHFKTGLQAAVTVLHKPGICCIALLSL